MKKLLLAFFGILLMSESIIAQMDPALKRSSHQHPINHKAIDIELVNPEKGKTGSGPFGHFEVVDARPDTSFIGVHTETLMLPMTRLRQMVLKGSVTRTIPDYLDNYFSNGENAGNASHLYKVLIVIRKLWVSDVTYSYRERESIEELNLRDDKFNIRLRAEIYISDNNASEDKQLYVPLLRYDSLMVMDKSGYDRVGGSLSALLQNLGDTLSVAGADKKWESGRKLTRLDIDRFSSSLFDFPIFRDSVLVKGVYANFDEFRNNAPSIRDYEIGLEKRRSVLYTRDASGQSYYNHNAWGVCDGKNLYVMLEGYVFSIFREQKAFYLSGFVEPKDNLDEVKDTRQTRVFAIDPDTGIIY